MRKLLFIFGLMTFVSLVLVSTPVRADEVPASPNPVKFSDEQVKLAQLNWNAYLDAVKANHGNPGYVPTGRIVSVYPDSVIGKAAVINHFSPYYPYYAATLPAVPNSNPAYTNNPYFDYYPCYYCTYQYR